MICYFFRRLFPVLNSAFSNAKRFSVCKIKNKSRLTFIDRLSSGNDRYLKQLSKLLEVLAEISENNEKNSHNCKSEGAEDQIISDKDILLLPDNENKT